MGLCEQCTQNLSKHKLTLRITLLSPKVSPTLGHFLSFPPQCAIYSDGHGLLGLLDLVVDSHALDMSWESLDSIGLFGQSSELSLEWV